MKIDNLNGNIINTRDIYIHDDIFENMIFHHKSRMLELFMRGQSNGEYKICYNKVIGFDMTSCRFWGESPHVLDFEYVCDDKRTLLPRLYGIKDQCRNNKMFDCEPIDNNDYIETVVWFVSGDKLTVVCEYIDFGKTELLSRVY